MTIFGLPNPTHFPTRMKRLIAPRILLCITFLAFAARLGVAQLVPRFTPGDTVIFTLKSGDKFEGKVLSDAPDSVEIEYKLTPKIKDKKIFQKSEIASVKKLRPSETEFAEQGLGKLLPTPDLKDAFFYESTIQDKLRTFVAKYPGTPEAAEAEKIIAALGEEKGKVMSGQLKVEGEWIDAAKAKRDAYNIEAYGHLLVMREKAAENKDTRYLEALRAFEKLRTDYRASPYFLKAIPEAQEYLKKLEVQLAEMIKEAPILLKNRTDGLKQLPANEAPAARKAIDEEERAYKEALDRQFRAKVRWHDISKFDVKGLQDIAAAITKERAELASLDLAAMQAESDSLIAVIRAIADKNVTEAGIALDKAAKIQSQANRALVAALRKEVDDLRKNARKEQKAAAAPAIAGSPSKTEGDPSASNPVAEAMKKLQEEKQKKAKPAGKAPEAKPEPAGAPKPAPPVAVATPEPKPGLMEMLNDYLPLIGGALLAIIALAWFMGKRKKEKEA